MYLTFVTSIKTSLRLRVKMNKSSAPCVCTPFPFLGFQLHNGVCLSRLKLAVAVEPSWTPTSFESVESWIDNSTKMASVSFVAKTVSAHSTTANQRARSIPEAFPSPALTH